MIRTAFVLGAGLGTRLKALTARRPKPLIPVANEPLIGYAFQHLLSAGIERLVVNTHWQSGRYAEYFPNGSYGAADLVFRHESPEVLETAGGIWNVRDLLGDEPFFVYNGDILTTLPIEPAIEAHLAQGNEVTMVLRSRDGPLQVAFDEATGRVTDLNHRVDPASALRFLFTGIYLVSPEFIRRIPPATKVSVIPIFCDMIRAGARLGGIVIDEGRWWDLGTREHYLDVHRDLATLPKFKTAPPPWIDPTARVARSAQLTGATAIGSGAVVGEDVRLHDCIVWAGARIAAGAVLERCVVTDGETAGGAHHDADFSATA
ncbi:MAG: mannose-phosphate guanylyltransferase [Chthoniobacter sp.]|jgi:NDP-sugar pyrophosphorylase family protein|nr:mannose-phosphate guanylyltransferase [Chthoniobacter sp.]